MLCSRSAHPVRFKKMKLFNARIAIHFTPNSWAGLVLHLAKPCINAKTAKNPSTISNAIDIFWSAHIRVFLLEKKVAHRCTEIQRKIWQTKHLRHLRKSVRAYNVWGLRVAQSSQSQQRIFSVSSVISTWNFKKWFSQMRIHADSDAGTGNLSSVISLALW